MADVTESAARFIKAFNAHDENAMRALNAPNFSFEAPGGIKLRGHEATGYASAWFKACPDAKITVRNEVTSGPWVVQEVTFEGTHQGPLQGPAGTIEATGRQLVDNSVIVTRFENGLAIESRLYFDQVNVLTQLGVMPTQVPATV